MNVVQAYFYGTGFSMEHSGTISRSFSRAAIESGCLFLEESRTSRHLAFIGKPWKGN